jgi:hypothetical protein
MPCPQVKVACNPLLNVPQGGPGRSRAEAAQRTALPCAARMIAPFPAVCTCKVSIWQSSNARYAPTVLPTNLFDFVRRATVRRLRGRTVSIKG